MGWDVNVLLVAGVALGWLGLIIGLIILDRFRLGLAWVRWGSLGWVRLVVLFRWDNRVNVAWGGWLV